MVDVEDNLGFQNNQDIKNKIGEETIYFSAKMQKIATEKRISFSFLTNQDRNLLITNLAIYNLNGTEIKRRIKIQDIKAITVSKTSNQFIIHGNQSEYDYLFVYKDRKKIAKILQSAFEAQTGKDLLFCKKEDKDLSKFVVGKKERLKNPYLFKISENELTSIKDYIEEPPEEEPEPVKSTPPPKASKKEDSKPPKVVSGKGAGVPPPPPPPPPPPKVATVPTAQKASSSKPVDLAAELAAKKNNLAHVEVKDYVSPALQKPEEGGAPQTGNSMMAAIMAKRNQMKKIGGTGAGGGASTTVKPPPKPSAPKPGGTTITAHKPNASGVGGGPKPGPKPVTHTAPKTTVGAPKPGPKPATGGAKPPMKMGGAGGGGAFAAKMAALQARMGGGAGGGSSSASSSTPASSGPSKPIVELCEGNTKRMDINKVIGNLEKEKKKQSATKLSAPPPPKVVAGKGKGIPPPPPPPPPPPTIK